MNLEQLVGSRYGTSGTQDTGLYEFGTVPTVRVYCTAGGPRSYGFQTYSTTVHAKLQIGVADRVYVCLT